MTTKTGIAHCTTRLLQCPDLAALQRVWNGIAKEYQHHPEVVAIKDQMKEALK